MRAWVVADESADRYVSSPVVEWYLTVDRDERVTNDRRMRWAEVRELYLVLRRNVGRSFDSREAAVDGLGLASLVGGGFGVPTALAVAVLDLLEVGAPGGRTPALGGGLDALEITPKTGREPFLTAGRGVGVTLQQFWAWSCSDLVGNTMRGVLAEFIVGLALGCVGPGTTRLEWDAIDLRTANGTRVEVKSSAYLQSWRQESLSKINFSIQPTTGWDAKTNTIAAVRERQSDAYVFCVFKHTDKATADPLDLDQWEFLVMSTVRLNAEVGNQKSISLASLLQRGPIRASFVDLACVVQQARDEAAPR